MEKNEGQLYMYLSHFVCRAYLRSLSSASQRAHVPRTSSGIAHRLTQVYGPGLPGFCVKKFRSTRFYPARNYF